MSLEHGTSGTDKGQTAGVTATVTLRACPERRLIRPNESHRHVDFQIVVSQVPGRVGAERSPVDLALVLDRSGSMGGQKLATATRAALAVVDRLDERDHVAVVIFDDRVDVVQPVAPASAAVQASVRGALTAVEARANTALHEGWLTGCQAIAAERAPTGGRELARCFLLTDGLANTGLTDPARIAAETAGIRAHAGIGTSTFGIGEDYDEELLTAMARAGGGQFHHLVTAGDILQTFGGELGDLLAVAVSRVRLEIELSAGITVELVSAYWETAAGERCRLIEIGDLLGGEERHVVVRFGFPARNGLVGHAVRARVVWSAAGADWAGDWQEIAFAYADHRACDAERRDPAVMHWVGLHHAERAKREATRLNRGHDLGGARETLRRVARRIGEYAGAEADLKLALRDLQAVEHELASAPVDALRAKEIYFDTQRKSRGQRDYREP